MTSGLNVHPFCVGNSGNLSNIVPQSKACILAKLDLEHFSSTTAHAILMREAVLGNMSAMTMESLHVFTELVALTFCFHRRLDLSNKIRWGFSLHMISFSVEHTNVRPLIYIYIYGNARLTV